MNLVSAQQLKYKYPNSASLALNELSFTVERGEFVGIVGMNGAGKTTLAYALSGLVPHFFKGAYGGAVLIDNQEVLSHEMSDVLSKVGIVFDNPFAQMTGSKTTVYEEIAFGLENRGIPRAQMQHQITECMRLLDIEDLHARNPFSLSGGQMQRVAIASILAMQPDVLILDEPTSQLDPKGTIEVFQLLRRLADNGMSIVLIEQDTEKLMTYTDRILFMHGGKLLQDSKPIELFSRDDLEAYGVEVPMTLKLSKRFGLPPHHALVGDGLYVWNNWKTTQTVQFSFDEDRAFNKQPKTSVIEVCHLTYQYDEKVVLRDINLSLSGEPIAIIGHNGAGKTTFVKLLKSLLKPNSGDVLIDGKNTREESTATIAKVIGLIFQNPADQIFKNSVWEEVLFGPLTIGQSNDVARANTMRALELVGLQQKADEHPYDLSLAERKMVTIASILAMDTPIVIFDEPTIGQDYVGKLRIKEIIRSLQASGKLVICILHDMEFVASTFDRTIIFHEGTVLFDGPTREAFKDQERLNLAKVEQPSITKIVRSLGYDEVVLKEEEITCD